MGHWHTTLSRSASNSEMDLRDIRKTAARILGMHKNEAPKALMDFLEGKPEADAFADFEKWDKVIETGFGGRRFAKMDVNF